MRLWSLHPRFLDPKGLVALWREGLLARAVLMGKTRGYQHHPQLQRFLECPDPVGSLDGYLSRVLDEAEHRSYSFDTAKINRQKCCQNPMSVTTGQLEYEWAHLMAKLKTRNPHFWEILQSASPTPNDCFHVVPGPVADWERQ